MRYLLFGLVFLGLACGRSPFVPNPTLTTCTDCPTTYERQDGLIVHEWGTFTSVLASDGSLLPGLHHEEEDLPPFVADRLAQASWGGDIYSNQKMETPVTYFYAADKLQVSAKVSFPKGMLTQWFPYVKAMKPFLYWDNRDPWLSTSVTPNAYCDVDYTNPFHDGLLDWGTFDVMEPGVTQPLASPLGETAWGFARNTASNALRVPGPAGQAAQYEKFLFYRGLGNFELPMGVKVEDGRATFTNLDRTAELGGLILMRVTAEGAGFLEVGDLRPGGSIEYKLPVVEPGHGDFVAALKSKLLARLIATGLYADEAQAMVDTWERAWFLTPGLRLLYLLPQVQTDALIPLTITPTPKALVRTMVIRVELMTPAEEETLSERLRATDDAFFLSHGRFAEPHLTRALQLVPDLGDPYSIDGHAHEVGLKLLEQVRAKQRWAPLASE